MNFLLHFFILLVLFTLSGFFSASETAIFSLSKIEKRRVQKKYPHLYPMVNDHLNHAGRTLTTMVVGTLLANTAAAAIVTLLVMERMPRALGWVMGVYTIVMIVFCEIIPKVLAVRKNEAVAAYSVIPLRFFSVFFYPVYLLTQRVIKRFHSFIDAPPAEKNDEVSEQEFQALVKIGEEEGVLDRQERMMIQKLFELGERPVREIMTPRVDMVGLDIEDPQEKHEEMMRKYHYTYFPVYKGSVDHILGYAAVQEYLLNDMRDLMQILKQPLFIPETKWIDELLEEFKQKKQHFAICVDEHGGTAGLVTLEDVLEEIFGEYHDEYSKVENPIQQLNPFEFVVNAKISLTDFNEFFKSSLESEDATTLGGFILERLGEVPKPGSALKLPEFEMRIQKMVRQRILTVIVRRMK
ncbi:MAG TPA: hemolysin family protein [Verrucomicrobiae bacterium]|jgi:CBS domain containing-hemolysin-like protein|nr:hemolysin family protein [Verrucomicrobiae bacterium]